jgi:hypothetical protein
MDILWLVFWSVVLCLFVTLIIFTFPSSFSRENMKHKIRKIQCSFLIFCVIVIIAILILALKLNVSILFVEYKIAIFIILIISCSLFSAFLLYPSVRALIKINTEDQSTISELTLLIFSCIYSGESGEREKSLDKLKLFCSKNESMLKQYGIYVYLSEYPKLVNPTAFKAPESMISFLISKCDTVKKEIDNFIPMPFPNIGLILSFTFSTILTILLSMLTI